jgi:hypothetical protein
MIDENICCCFMSLFPQAFVDEERALRLALGKPVGDQTPQCKVKWSPLERTSYGWRAQWQK